MKRIITALLLTSVLFLVSCSDFEQESSPIVPEFQKVSSGQHITNGIYQYLQNFDFIPVKSVQSTTTLGSIDILISPDLFPKYFLHMFVVLEYRNTGFPLTNEMIFVGKPNSNVIRLDGINEKNLNSVKVYAYIPGNDVNSISPPYNYLTSFKELTVDEWSSSNNQIVIITQDWNTNLRDTFVELTLESPGKQNHVLTYVAQPTTGTIVLPKSSKDIVTQVRMYGIFSNVQL